jgi:hypothetical protein
MAENDRFPLLDLSRVPIINKAYKRDLMWVPVVGKECEIWAARSQDGKRQYNVRGEFVLSAGMKMWTALWSADDTPNVFSQVFISRYDAQNVCEELENQFKLDPKEVAEEKKRLSDLSQTDWCFQGVHDGMSIWTLRNSKDVMKAYVIIHDGHRRPNEYSLSIRWREDADRLKDFTTLKMESLGVYTSLEKAQDAVKQLKNG